MDAPLGALRSEDEDVRVSVLEMDGVGVVEREEIAEEEGELLELAIVELAPGKERVELDGSGIVMRIVSGVMLVSDAEYEEHKASFAEYALDKSDVLQAATRQFEKAVRKAGTVVRHAQPTSV